MSKRPSCDVSEIRPQSVFSLRTAPNTATGWVAESDITTSFNTIGENQPSEADPMWTRQSRSGKIQGTTCCRRGVLATMVGASQTASMRNNPPAPSHRGQRRRRLMVGNVGKNFSVVGRGIGRGSQLQGILGLPTDAGNPNRPPAGSVGGSTGGRRILGGSAVEHQRRLAPGASTKRSMPRNSCRLSDVRRAGVRLSFNFAGLPIPAWLLRQN